MKKLLQSSLLIALGGLLSLNSCKKEDDPDTTPTPSPVTPPKNEPPTVKPGDANAVLAAIKTFTATNTPMGTVLSSVGVAAANYSNDNFSTLLDAGGISVDGTNLSKTDNNSYYFAVSTTQPTGINFGNTTDWTVNGNAASGVEAGTYSDNNAFPTLSEINYSNANLAVNADFTLSTKTSISNADSIIYMVAGPDKAVMKTTAGNTSSATFTAAEMGSLGKGENAGLISVTAYKIKTTTTAGGKKIYLIKESYISKMVNLQ